MIYIIIYAGNYAFRLLFTIYIYLVSIKNRCRLYFYHNYFIAPNNRLYSDFKFYRVTKIKKFIFIKDLKFEPKNSIEFKIIQILFQIEYNIEI